MCRGLRQHVCLHSLPLSFGYVVVIR
jgi:hypothetical protein